MISYIFKNKIKNIFVAITSVFFLCISLKELRAYMIVGAWNDMTLKLISFIPYLLVFLYMVNLKNDYKLKHLLFPIAFAISALSTIFSIRDCFYEYTFSSINGIIELLIGLSIRIVMIMGYVFCFIGTLSNFKKLIFLRLGLIFCIITNLALSFYYYHLNQWTENWIGNEFFSTNYYLSEILKSSIILFYISIFVLTLTKKSEYIDITPYVEKRKIKKEIKKAEKLARETPEKFSPPTVSEGYWRCMGCGEILPDDKTECDCGYKR